MFDDYAERYSRMFLPLFIGAAVLLVYVAGRSQPITVPDSTSYLEYPFASLEGIGQAIRTPVYPIWLALIGGTIGLAWVPLAQAIVHATASWCFFREIRRWGLPTTAALIVAATIGVGCTAMDNVSTLASDCLAASFGVLTVTCLMRWSRRGDSLETILALVMMTLVTVMTRPAYLFLIPWIVVASLLLHRLSEGSFGASLLRSLRIVGLIVLALIGWMFFRFSAVGDFGFLPFGHQNLGGVLVQLLSDEELESLPGEVPSILGSEIVQQKHRYDQEVGFEAGEPGATMTIEANWDEMTYLVVIPSARKIAGQNNVTYHRELKKLNRAILWNYPQRYVVWIAKAIRRGAWGIAADIVMHPIFLASLILLVLLVMHRAFWDGFAITECSDCIALRALLLIAFSYAAAGLAFVVLTSPPIGRFSDATAIFIPGCIAAVFLHWWNAPPE